METQLSSAKTHQDEFAVGDFVIYGIHGKCKILGIDIRNLDGKSIRFYKLHIEKSPLSRTHRQDPAIWVPVENARHLGLRPPMSKTEADECIALLSSRDVPIQTDELWPSVQTQLESVIRFEGGLGLAKAFCFTYVLKNRYALPPSDLNKFYDLLHRLLFKELSEALGQPPHVIEKNLVKGLKSKL